MAHDYGDVDLDQVWKTATEGLPGLIEILDRHSHESEGNEGQTILRFTRIFPKPAPFPRSACRVTRRFTSNHSSANATWPASDAIPPISACRITRTSNCRGPRAKIAGSSNRRTSATPTAILLDQYRAAFSHGLGMPGNNTHFDHGNGLTRIR